MKKEFSGSIPIRAIRTTIPLYVKILARRFGCGFAALAYPWLNLRIVMARCAGGFRSDLQIMKKLRVFLRSGGYAALLAVFLGLATSPMFAQTPSVVSNPGPVDNRTVPSAPTGVLAQSLFSPIRSCHGTPIPRGIMFMVNSSRCPTPEPSQDRISSASGWAT